MCQHLCYQPIIFSSTHKVWFWVWKWKRLGLFLAFHPFDFYLWISGLAQLITPLNKCFPNLPPIRIVFKNFLFKSEYLVLQDTEFEKPSTNTNGCHPPVPCFGDVLYKGKRRNKNSLWYIINVRCNNADACKNHHVLEWITISIPNWSKHRERERESAPILNLKKMYSYLHGILARVHIAF